jgi:hypothetical protein
VFALHRRALARAAGVVERDRFGQLRLGRIGGRGLGHEQLPVQQAGPVADGLGGERAVERRWRPQGHLGRPGALEAGGEEPAGVAPVRALGRSPEAALDHDRLRHRR